MQGDPFFIQPIEPLYFGQARSFSAGESHSGRSQFPPTPFTFQGLVRSHLLRSVTNPVLNLDDWSKTAKAEREKLIGPPGKLPETWQLQGPYPAQKVHISGESREWLAPWVPAPRFMLQSSQENRPEPARIISSSHPGLDDRGEDKPLSLGRPDRPDAKPLHGWIGPDNLALALDPKGNHRWDPDQQRAQRPPFVHEEVRPGIQIDSQTGTVSPGMLYTLNTLRFDSKSGFVGSFSGLLDHHRIKPHPLIQGVGGMGNRNRVVQFEKPAPFHPSWQRIFSGQHLPRQVEKNHTFWLLTLNPVRLQDLNHPLTEDALSPQVRIRFLGAMLGKLQVLGGFYMSKAQSHANRQFVPAGSAWLFRLEGGEDRERREVLQQLNDAHLIGDPQEQAFGFGHTVVGIGPTSWKE
ncbi:MAG: hypothetical protein HQL52_10490 [Magnetococcales bacterium]|nr:hypothetical protein [Magnetococcales bacterium]